MFRDRIILAGILTVALCSLAVADTKPSVQSLLQQKIIDPSVPVNEVREFTQSRVVPFPDVKSVEEWETHAKRMRRETLQKVVLRGEAAGWKQLETKVQWLETIEGGPGYDIHKLRYEAVPGMWIPALLYVPENLEGKVPVVMNVNGHARTGKVTQYKQIRCINQAKRGMLVLNPEWVGMGQLATTDFAHSRMNQLDLCGTSGLAPFYLSMKRGLDVLLSLENADPTRVAVMGLSGGGWQTIVISSLDTRVTLANPVAGYSSFRSRARNVDELGDSEQTPVDLGTIADYDHLTALRAPRPTLLTYNAYDNCCFKAGNALPSLLGTAGPIFQLYGKRANLRSHVNYIPGTHNFALENRLESYRMIGEHFFPGEKDFVFEEIECQNEVKTKGQLHVDIPRDNAGFHTLALAISKNLPRHAELPSNANQAKAWQSQQRTLLADTIKAHRYEFHGTRIDEKTFDAGQATFWQLKTGGDWTLPAVELSPANAKSTVILVADGGRKSVVAETQKLLDQGHRVLAVDPFYFGESHINSRDYLYALLVSTVGERPLGIQASQLAAVARWSKKQFGTSPVTIHAVGPRSSLFTLAASALETDAISGLELQDCFGSVKQVIEQNMTVKDAPELFCFGLLEHFDIQQLTALTAPRPVKFSNASERARTELKALKPFYAVFGVDFEPLQ